MTVKPGAWRKKTLMIPPDARLRTWLSQTEAAQVLGLGRSGRKTLYRLGLRNEGPPFEADRFDGRERWFQLVGLIAWFGSVTQDGRYPSTVQGVWHWWAIEQGRPVEEVRPKPVERGSRPRGCRTRHWKQKCRIRTRTLGALVLAAAKAENPKARRELVELVDQFRKGTWAGLG